MLASTARRISRTLDVLRPLWAGMFVALLVIPTPDRFPLRPSVALPITAVFLLLWAIAGQESMWWRPTPLDLAWLIWLLLIPVTLWATPLPEVTSAALRLFVAQTIAFWTMVVWVRSHRRAEWGTAGLLLFITALTALGFLLMQWPPEYTSLLPARFVAMREHILRLAKESVNPNVLAGILVPTWCLALSTIPALRGGWRWPLRMVMFILIIAMGALMFLSQSRGSWIAALLGAYVLISMARRWALAGWLGLPVIIGYLHTTGRLLPLLHAALAVQYDSGLIGRVAIWSRAFYALQDFVFTGVGMGAFPHVVRVLYPLFAYDPTTAPPHAHNIFLQVGVDLGVFGLIAFLAMLLTTAFLVWRALKSPSSFQAQPSLWLLRGGAAGLIAALVHGMVDAVTWNTRPAFIVWALWGLTIGIALTIQSNGT